MPVQWTKEQQQVIHLTNRNILVSAAAGSGKTAVLVERILTMMTRQENPVDIDRLLIVTFTRAAAGEMRERLAASVERRLQEEPDNEHLQRQQTLIHNAQINTIDGFCSYVIRNYFHTIDLDPGFRTASEGELKLLKTDVVQEVLEAAYARGEERYHQFVESFSAGKTDEGLGDMILRLYEFSMSNPWPEEWLNQCRIPYEAEDFSQLQERAWMRMLWEDAGRDLAEADRVLTENEELTGQEDGPHTYEEAARADRMLLDALWDLWRQRDFDGLAGAFDQMKFTALSRKKDPEASEEKKEAFKMGRDRFKEILKDVKERYFYGNSEEIMEELAVCRGPVEELIDLTLEFMRAFAEKKRQKNLVDFSDMEHFALEILVKRGEDGSLQYTEAAEEFSDRFEEILIDEYQDSNLVQETLLTSVSRIRRGIHNIFMVGDVKQSIYRFRLARPELFMEKYETYSLEDGPCQRIDLHRNFRSRAQVLSGVNFIFRQIMGKELGGVEYDQAAALYPGASFPPMEEGQEPEGIQVLLTELDAPETEDDATELTAQELEARAVGEEIRRMVGRVPVLDKETGEYRPARYRDCVVLLRTITGWADVFVRVLMNMGIPAYSTSKTGYFSALEVVTVLNYLHICDNPMQEIPFTAVLASPMGGFCPEELARIRGEFSGQKMYLAAESYSREGTDDELREKLGRFFAVYQWIRRRVPDTPIHQLIHLILQETGYGLYAQAMPGGEQRQANLEMLEEKAMEFEETSYRGLFNFIRYIENLQKYQVDFGEVSTIGENEDTVRIMSIHKSKGLEFPVVFVSGLGKRFNMTDANAGLVIHPDLGVGCNAIRPGLRIKAPSLMRQVIQKQLKLESLGEELRVLYVALTRAKERLILTGTVEKLDQKAAQWHRLYGQPQERLPYGILESASSFWGWILPALARHPAFDVIWQRIGRTPDPVHICRKDEAQFAVRCVRGASQTQEELTRQMYREERRHQLLEERETLEGDSGLGQELARRFSWEYPYTFLQEIPAVVSVSELKRSSMEMEDFQGERLFPEETPNLIPAFMQTEEQELVGSDRGTAYHRFLEGLNYGNAASEEAIRQQLEKMTADGKLTETMAASVRPAQILWFAGSPLGRRMARAQEAGRLVREQQFVMEIPASEKNPLWDTKEQILVQGVIDAFFEEADGLVLVDYKTDYVPKGQEELLLKKYQTQLNYYRKALGRITGKPVRETWIYSFGLGKALAVPEDEN
ncbi:MAG: helicase-exonuclease AddAB subunit AddA [Clostridiales bacterium]|nr:helicase-exonuclease AddAB subunit AddA [Clostridiales bacterium]